MSLRVTILGCGSSGGVPRIGSMWGKCDPDNPKNRRRRCSILVERIEARARRRVLVDTSPDLREQLLCASAPTPSTACSSPTITPTTRTASTTCAWSPTP